MKKWEECGPTRAAWNEKHLGFATLASAVDPEDMKKYADGLARKELAFHLAEELLAHLDEDFVIRWHEVELPLMGDYRRKLTAYYLTPVQRVDKVR